MQQPRPGRTLPVSIEKLPTGEVRLRGPWNLRGLQTALQRLETELQEASVDAVWDLRQIEALDSLGAMILWRAWDERRPRRLELRPEHRSFFDALEDAPEVSGPPPEGALLARPIIVIGERVLTLLRNARALISVLGQLLLDFLYLLRHPSRIPWRELSAVIHREGTQALPITGLVGFLIGTVLCYLAARQLTAYGVEELVIDLAGIGITRELGPLIGCILLVGRSGSSITAQISAMRLTQELDALEALGISRSLRLILPRVVGLTVVGPLIAFWTSAFGIVGSLVVARIEIGIPMAQFVVQLGDRLPAADVLFGLGKSLAFGLAIGLIACYLGLLAKADTRSLGVQTTRSVVIGITALIVLDAVFAVIFHGVGSL